MNTKLFGLAFVAVLFCSSSAIMIAHADQSDAVELPPDCDFVYEVVNKTYYTNSKAETIYLSSRHGDGEGLAEIIGGSNMQGNLSVDTRGAPSWITYTLFPNRYDVMLTISPGAVVDDTFWILFKCFNGDARILLTFNIQILDSGSVIPEDYYEYTLKFDTAGGSRIGDVGSQSLNTSYTFDLDKVKTPSRDGYDFRGWSADSSGNSVLINKNYTLTIPSGSTNASATLYAVWEPSSGPGVDTIYYAIAGVIASLALLMIVDSVRNKGGSKSKIHTKGR